MENRILLDVEKAQEKCGTCGNWYRKNLTMDIDNKGYCYGSSGSLSPFICPADSICLYSEPSHWKPIPNPEQSLENLKRKQADIVGADYKSLLENFREIKEKYDTIILKLESQIDKMAIEHGKIVRELAEKTKECETYMRLFQVYRARGLKVMKILDGKEG